MCYKALTCNVEIYGYIFLSCGNERKIKISYSLVVQKGKIYRYLWDVFLMLWTFLGLGRDMHTTTLSFAYMHACPKAVCACLMHVYTYTGMRVHARVQETMKCKLFYIKAKVWNESHIIREPFQTLIFELYKAIHSSFSKHIENPKGKHQIH